MENFRETPPSGASKIGKAYALVAELADALVSGTSGRKAVEVQVLSRAIVRNEQLN